MKIKYDNVQKQTRILKKQTSYFYSNTEESRAKQVELPAFNQIKISIRFFSVWLQN